MEVTCQRCNASNRSTAQFCDQCGSPLPTQNQSQNAAAQQPTESPVGRTFESAVSQPSAITTQHTENTESTQSRGRPTSLPEQDQVKPKQPAQPKDLPPYTPARPSGVAFEMGGGSSGGRPLSLPEQHGGNTTPSDAPKYAAKGNHVIGEVREFRERHESEGQLSWIIWSFRVERYDATGNRLQPVPVEMKGMTFDGTLSDGDWVELPVDWKPGQVARPTRVINLTTGASIIGSVPASAKIGRACGWVMFAIFMIGVIAIIIFIFISSRM